MGQVGYQVGMVALLVACPGGSVMTVDMAGLTFFGEFVFWIASNACRVSFCFRFLYIADILWIMIQDSLGSFYVSVLLLNIDDFNNPVFNYLV